MGSNNIVIIGAMGVGKSTVGRRLAKRLSRDFYDSDKIIENKTGVDIPTIFEYEGEDGFRKREEEVIKNLCDLENIVLATGGGAVISQLTRKRLSKTGVIFYLKATVETLVKRTHMDANRPLLNAANKKQKIKELLLQREPLYKEIADHEIETDGHTINWAVNKILNLIETNK